MKKETNLKLNCCIFEVDKKLSTRPYFKGRTLDDVYISCSSRKSIIFDDWRYFFVKCISLDLLTDVDFYITSSNSNFFTLGGVMYFKNGFRYFKITAHHNYVSELFLYDEE